MESAANMAQICVCEKKFLCKVFWEYYGATTLKLISTELINPNF